MNSLIWGQESPQYEFDGVIYKLDHVIVSRDDPDYTLNVNESVVNGHRNKHHKWHHWDYWVRVFINKYSDPIGSYMTFKSHETQTIDKLWRSRDKLPFLNSAGDPVSFSLDEVIPIFFNPRKQEIDMLIMKFSSDDPVAEEKSINAVPLDDLGRVPTDDIGRTMPGII